MRGIEVTEENTSIEVMKSVCLDGPGHYLGTEQTLRIMQSEYVCPALANRSSPKEWVEKGRPILLDSARARVREVLAQDGHRIAPDMQAQLEAAFDLLPLKRIHEGL